MDEGELKIFLFFAQSVIVKSICSGTFWKLNRGNIPSDQFNNYNNLTIYIYFLFFHYIFQGMHSDEITWTAVQKHALTEITLLHDGGWIFSRLKVLYLKSKDTVNHQNIISDRSGHFIAGQ